ncbi:ATP-binding cassette domain-containing protein [Bifidobacterium animalis]|uniref:ATP-binding cassette domain-containing protein n=1 Tax=Bifidobacterium animalis TaxID=28025 RepID=UPI000419E490|nr:ATP-binding cassette domain-containing protein [Bifidobacterium animalis]KOA47628.1 hypothetical protein BAAA27673_02895 [Bifidobacterium animalis subsp. lactis ATCC 27673]
MKIALDHVTKHYPDFDLDVTMEVPDDTITALIGTNGSGKTTTFRLMLGLARPAGGEGIILGDPIRRVGGEREIAHRRHLRRQHVRADLHAER